MSVHIEEATPKAAVDKPELGKPPMYKVVLLNDDYTPMEFVVDVLCKFFQKAEAEAISIMLQVHHNGSGLCGLYVRDVAETKVDQVLDFSRGNGYPLQCVMEKNHAE